MSAALSLVGILVFAATGLTLNNAGWIDAQPDITNRTLTVPPALLATLTPPAQEPKAPLPAAMSKVAVPVLLSRPSVMT